jgi:hypothetical protein
MKAHPRFWLASVLIIFSLLVVLVIGAIVPPPAVIAAIRQLEEAPGQQVYQSRQTLRDAHGNPWQAIVFQRIRPDGTRQLYLRLVGFPGTATIDRNQPLTLTNSLGKTLVARDVSSGMFTDADQPEPHVGQYDLQPILSELSAVTPIRLLLPTIDQGAIGITVPAMLIQEWQTVTTKTTPQISPE